VTTYRQMFEQQQRSAGDNASRRGGGSP
jgi:hypothetical protein